MIAGVIIHTIMALLSLANAEYPFIFYLILAVVIFNVIGIILIKAHKIILGARVYLISSAILVPIGLIGAMGAVKIIDEEKRKQFINS